MHHIYHTRALVLGSKNHGEAGKVFFLFTRQLGMVYASASGIRKMQSKLRYVVQDYAYINVDLVKGKDMWRLTTATKIEEGLNIEDNYPALRLVAQVSNLLRKLLAGEEANGVLFDEVVAGFRALLQEADGAKLESLELVLVLRVLHHLGYIGNLETVGEFVASPLGGDVLYQASQNRASILREINKALRETHLT